MLAHTKKLPTESITICITGPLHKKEELPGIFLAGARFREGMTQEQLATATGIPRRHISEMENNKRPIGKKNARRLAEALHVDPRVFLSA